MENGREKTCIVSSVIFMFYIVFSFMWFLCLNTLGLFPILSYIRN